MITLNYGDLKSDIKNILRQLVEADKKVVEECERIIRVVTDKLLEEAVKRAPVDEGFLEKSITKEVLRSPILSKLEGRVFIPANSPASDYALYMHEKTYNLGTRSQDKQAGSTVVVGRKYIERALTENEKAFSTYIYMKLKELLK